MLNREEISPSDFRGKVSLLFSWKIKNHKRGSGTEMYYLSYITSRAHVSIVELVRSRVVLGLVRRRSMPLSDGVPQPRQRRVDLHQDYPRPPKRRKRK